MVKQMRVVKIVNPTTDSKFWVETGRSWNNVDKYGKKVKDTASMDESSILTWLLRKEVVPSDETEFEVQKPRFMMTKAGHMLLRVNIDNSVELFDIKAKECYTWETHDNFSDCIELSSELVNKLRNLLRENV